MLNDVLFFPITETATDNLAQIHEDEKFTRQVFCQKKSIPQSEFFSAGQTDIKPSCILVVNTLDYQNEKRVKYNETIYDIYREYNRDDERTELYCEVRSAGQYK